MTETRIKYSVIMLLEERHADFADFVQNLYDLFSIRNETFEIIIMANGMGGFLRRELPRLRTNNNAVRAFVLTNQTPQAVALKAALRESAGKIIVVCGSYQQITKDSFDHLLDSLDDETDLIIAWRHSRVDPYLNRLQSRVFNTVVSWITKTDFHDFNCTVRVFHRDVLDETEIYGNMYRFLPVFAERRGFEVKEIKCQHYQERGQTGFYGLSSYVTRLIDIFTLFFNTRFTKKPLRFFSSIGLGSLITGLFITFYVFVERFFLGHPIGDRPILLLALFFMALGVQVGSVGLLGEIIAFVHGRQMKEYTVEKLI